MNMSNRLKSKRIMGVMGGNICSKKPGKIIRVRVETMGAHSPMA